MVVDFLSSFHMLSGMAMDGKSKWNTFPQCHPHIAHEWDSSLVIETKVARHIPLTSTLSVFGTETVRHTSTRLDPVVLLEKYYFFIIK